MVKVQVLNCGYTVVDEALPLSNKSKNPLAYTGLFRGKRHIIQVPVTAYLIEHPNALILVDTGWDTAIRTNARAYEGFINYFASPGFLPNGQAVTEHLTRLGYAPSDIDYVLLTHMDIDHAGGLQLVKNAKHIMASNAELKAAKGHHPRYLKRLWQEIDIEPFPDRKHDLLGDGSVMLLPLHGHSAGNTGVLIKGKNGFVLITGDACYAEESWRELVLPGICYNKAAAIRSLKIVQKFGKSDKCRAILATHDRRSKPRAIEI